jgi:hypothetical protein
VELGFEPTTMRVPLIFLFHDFLQSRMKSLTHLFTVWTGLDASLLDQPGSLAGSLFVSFIYFSIQTPWLSIHRARRCPLMDHAVRDGKNGASQKVYLPSHHNVA